MSDPPQKPPLDYASPVGRDLAKAGVFFGSVIIWGILTPGLIVGCGGVGAALSDGNSIAIGVGALFGLLLLGLIFTHGRRVGNPSYRSARTAGALVGAGVAVMLVGGCFAAFSGAI